jgi:hypothetical protein
MKEEQKNCQKSMYCIDAFCKQEIEKPIVQRQKNILMSVLLFTICNDREKIQ